jgi:7-cyano-7-deazaguanine tRNA-ribosyltransferase
VLVVAGLSLNNLKPHVWDATSPYYLPDLQAVMVSYADFHRNPVRRRAAMSQGLHSYLGVPQHITVYLDNGAFYFIGRTDETPRADYEAFIAQAKPDWWPIPQDYIPIPQMTPAKQEQCYKRTMQVNLEYQHDGYVPVVHISNFLEQYTVAVTTHERLAAKPSLALGGIVPNLLRTPKALPYREILRNLKHVRQTFPTKRIHIYGIGGTATLHIATLLAFDSADSSGWRNRAARGIIQLPGTGDRMVANLGSWRGRKPSEQEWDKIRVCPCPACDQFGVDGLEANGIYGFSNRSAHNLWVLLQEVQAIESHLTDESYSTWYKEHLDNTTYLPLIEQLVNDTQAD